MAANSGSTGITPSADILEELRRIEILQDLANSDFAFVVQRLRRIVAPKGKLLVHAGEQDGQFLYMIVRGAVKIFLAEPDGSEVILSVIGPRRTFGDMSLVDGMVRSANVAAMQRSLLYWMNRNDFSECVKAIPAFHDAILHSMSMRVRLANEHICALASLESKHRIARALRMFADDYGVPNGAGTLIPFPITQSEIASLVGISRVRVNQIVSAWKQQGVIAIDGRHRITLMKSDALPSPRDPIDSTSDSDAR